MKYVVELVKTEYRDVQVTADTPKEAEELVLAQLAYEEWTVVGVNKVREENT